MIKKIISIHIIILMFALVGVAGCAVNPVTGKKEFIIVSEAQEISMGRKFYPGALWGDGVGGGGEFGRNSELKRHLALVINDIHINSHRPNLPLEFAIQNSSIPNAWAIPGHVVITRGLLSELANEAEFAFVMGHEVGHVSARHSARQQSHGLLQQLGLGVTSIALGDSQYSDAALAIGSVGSSLLLLKYSRSDELEADGLGIDYMGKLGYDPKYGVSAHQNLERVANAYMKSLGKSSGDRSFFEDLVSTHPRTSVRIGEIREMIKNSPKHTLRGNGAGSEKFKILLAGLKKKNELYLKYYDPATRALKKGEFSKADRLIALAIKAAPSEAPFHALKGFIMIKKKRYDRAGQLFATSLIKDSGYQPALRGLGVTSFLKGDYNVAIERLGRAIEVFPGDASARYFMGMSNFKLNRYKTALPHLTAFA